MRREYTLPWTCETSDKIKFTLVITSLIGFPLAVILSVYFGLQYQYDNIGGLLAISTIMNILFGSIMYFYAFAIWDFGEFLPHFRCKQQAKPEVEHE